MEDSILRFPSGFLWGTATAAHQVEGNNTNNNWYVWENTSGKIHKNEKAGSACDWWNGRWKEDLGNAARDGQNTHRFSIEWSRIEPQKGKWDDAALEHYRQMILGMKKLGLKLFVTLHHFSEPIWIYESGGWENDETPKRFAQFVRKVVESLHDSVDFWVTLNEPVGYVLGGYMSGDFPPGKKDLKAAFNVMKNLIIAHSLAYSIIHEIQADARVGFSKYFRAMAPARDWFLPDRWITNFSFNSFNNAFTQTLIDGKLKFAFSRVNIPQAVNTQDYIGVNYYSRDLVKFKLSAIKDLFQERFYPPDAALSETGFIANIPQGFMEGLLWAQKFDLPIYITENGVEDSQGTFRPRYLIDHVAEIWKAIEMGMEIRGYMHWSQIDNFEWERGWSQRFGLWELDIKTQKRIKRPSANIFAEICHKNGIPLNLIQKYSPYLSSLFSSIND